MALVSHQVDVTRLCFGDTTGTKLLPNGAMAVGQNVQRVAERPDGLIRNQELRVALQS